MGAMEGISLVIDLFQVPKRPGRKPRATQQQQNEAETTTAAPRDKNYRIEMPFLFYLTSFYISGKHLISEVGHGLKSKSYMKALVLTKSFCQIFIFIRNHTKTKSRYIYERFYNSSISFESFFQNFPIEAVSFF